MKSSISFVPEAGVCQPGTEIRILDKSSVNVDIRFTQDGSAPEASSLLYQTPIKLVETSLFRATAFMGTEQASPGVIRPRWQK